MKIKGPEDLPFLDIKAVGRHVLLLVEPKETETKSGLVLVEGPYDKHMDPGIGWVLSASESYCDQNPCKEFIPDPGYGDLNYEMSNDVKRGDKVIFRRYMRTDKVGQGMFDIERGLQGQFPGHELVFLHVNHLIGVIEED